MIFSYIPLFGRWNGLNISWAHGDTTLNNMWHRWGLAIMLLIGATAVTLSLPYGLYIVNPALLLGAWHGGILTVFILATQKYLYDWIINVTRNKYDTKSVEAYIKKTGHKFEWSYCGSKDQKFWKAEFYSFLTVTLAWAFLGGYLVTAVNSY